MADDDDVDIYGDLTNFGEKSSDDCSEYTLELKKKCTDLEDKVVNLEKELESLRTIKNTLEVNLSSLVKTAKTEIARKDRMITELRTELENSLFRRNNYRIPKINRNNDSNNAPVVKTPQSNNYPMTAVETVETRVNKIEPVYLKPFTVAKNDDNDDDDGGSGEINQPNKFASTVYGERLRKKLMEQEATEKLQREQSKLVTLTTMKTEIKEEPGTDSTNINRDNKENQFHQIAPNEVNVENPTKKSLKRSNDEELNGRYDKRKKVINHKIENADKKDDKNSGNMNISAPHETTDKKINYRLEPIDSLLKNPSQKHEEEPTIQKSINVQRDKYPDKYRKHRSHSRSRSRDSNHSDRRKNLDSRNRESNRRRNTERSDHYRSASDRDIQNKYENRRDPRDRITKNFSNGSKRVMDLRNNIDHNKRRGNERKTDRKYQARDEKGPYRKRKRSGGSQHNRNNNQSKDLSRNADINKRDRSKSSTETFSDKSNDSFTLRKSETQTLPKIEGNVVIENEVATSLNSLEEGEILGSPISTPQKNTINNIVPNKELKVASTDQVLDNNLLSTLSVETPKVVITSRNYLKSPQEENIENIAGFIRNFSGHDVSNEPSSTIINKLSGHSAVSSCNTTKKVAEALEYEANDDITIANSEKKDTAEHMVEPCINHNGTDPPEPPSSTQSPANSAELEGSVNNSPTKPKASKVDTISINNVSTSYADVLSKYVRKKKKSTTSDSDSTIPENDSSSLTGINDVKEVTKSEKIINNESLLPACSKKQHDNMKHDSMQKKTDENAAAPVQNPLLELPCKENMEPPKDIRNADKIQTDTMDKKGMDAAQSVNVKSEKSDEAVKLPDVETQINGFQMAAVSNENETDHSAREDKKLTLINDAPIPQGSKCNIDSDSRVVCTQSNTSKDLRIMEQKKVETNDKISDEIEEKNETVELKIKKSSNILPEDICEQKCKDNIEKNTEDKTDDCSKLVTTSTKNEKKIVVARRKKRPVQLTNSSNSLTVVLSAYNVNNNRICKSRMKTPVTLTDT